MSNRQTRHRVFLLTMGILSLLIACGRSPAVEQTLEPSAPMAEAAFQTSPTKPAITADTPAPTPAPTAVPTTRPTTTAAPTATATVTPTPTATATPSPTYDVALYGRLDDVDPGHVTVTFWHPFTGYSQDRLAETVMEFNETNAHGIAVEMHEAGGYNQIYEEMRRRIEDGQELPGLVAAFPNQATDYQAAAALVSLDPYLNHAGYGLSYEAMADFFPAALSADRQPQFDDRLSGLPLNRSMELLYVNTDWLAQLEGGFTGPPQTPAQFTAAACAATDPAAGTVGYEVELTTGNFMAWIFAFGGDIVDDENQTLTYHTPAAVAAMTMVQQLVQQGCAVVAQGFDYQDDFGNGKTLFGPGTSRGLYFYQRAIASSEAGPFNWSVAPLPHTTDTPASYISGSSLVIPKTEPATQLAAWLFLRYFTSPETQARWAQVNDNLPARAGAVAEMGDYLAEKPAYETVLSLMPHGKSPPPAAGRFEVWQATLDAYERILRGEDVTTVLTELDETINQ